jgi:phosphoglycolate phosphatase-like HAD superfamily hydrolase
MVETTATTKDTLSTRSTCRAILFDVDGTLADSGQLGFDATVVVLEKNGIPSITEDIYHAYTIYATPERMARHAGHVPGDDDFEAVGQALGQQFDDLYIGLVDTQTAGFYPGVASMLERIPANVKLGALTNAACRYADEVLKANSQEIMGSLELYHRFLSIRGADNVPQAKPSPAGLLQICQDIGVPPAECVYIGDSPSDGAAAHAAGMPSVGVLWGSHSKESLQKAPFSEFCETLNDLEEVLLGKVSQR